MKNYSTTIALLKITEQRYANLNVSILDLEYTFEKKGFYADDHEILLHKLSHLHKEILVQIEIGSKAIYQTVKNLLS